MRGLCVSIRRRSATDSLLNDSLLPRLRFAVESRGYELHQFVETIWNTQSFLPSSVGANAFLE